jgi:outer membrane immunogenic protein
MRVNFGWALASVVSLGISGLASAADLPVYRKAPAPIVETYNWTGFYVGLEGGGDFGRTQVIHGPNDPRVGLPNIPETNAFNTTAGLAGVVAGYNYQINQVVLGIEGDFSGVWGATSSFDVAPFNSAFSQQVEQRWLATVRGRVGFLVQPNLLIYGTAGYAASEVRQTVFGPIGSAVVPIAENQTMTGWTAGAGAEWRFFGNWSAKAEYLFVDLGQKSFFNPAPNLTFVSDQRVKLRSDIVRVGINYQFGGPIMAKY